MTEPLRVFTSDASWSDHPSHASTRPRKYHWPRGDGMSSCGRAAIIDDEQGRNPQYVPPIQWCGASGCRQKFDVLPSGPYFLEDCGCVRYEGDLDAHHYTSRCGEHRQGKASQ